MSELYPRSPRGFAYLTEGLTEFPRAGDVVRYESNNVASETIEQLWDKYESRMTGEISITDTLILVKLLKHHFGDFRKWCMVQAKCNNQVNTHAIDFIVDTINFTNGYMRDLPQMTYLQLIDIADGGSSRSNETKTEAFKNISIPKTEDLLKNWLQQSTGVEDMFLAAKILFGKK